MPVGVMLNSMSSRELAEWSAYEKLSGPLGDQYADVTLASLHEQGQLTNYLLGALYASWTEGDNPIQKPDHLKRPAEIFADEEEDEAPPLDGTEESPRKQVVPAGFVPWQVLVAQIELDQGKK